MLRNAGGRAGTSAWRRKSRPSRRTRIRLLPVRTIVTRSQTKGGGGGDDDDDGGCFFRRLPPELFQMIMDKLSVLEISVFSMASKEMSGYIMDYISSPAWNKSMINRSFHHPTCTERMSTIQHYSDLGLLFKRCTLLLPTKERLKFTFHNFSQVPCLTLDQCLTPNCAGLPSYGAFLQTFIAGWDELECHRVFNFLSELTNLLPKIESVVTAKPGARWHHELHVHLLCRHVLLDPWPSPVEWQFWLIQLLKPWPMVSQARLLLILYGPLLPEGAIGWQELVERGVPHGALCDLARAILLLFSKPEVKGWSTDSILAVLQELFVIPQPWHLENVARLLVLCGSTICYSVLATKALSGHFAEISRLIVYITLVCEKEGYHMSWAVKLVQQVCGAFTTPPEKFFFIQHLENMFAQVTREFFQFSVTGNRLEDRETFCILLDSSARFHAKFLYMLLK